MIDSYSPALRPEFAPDKYVAKRDSVVGIIPESFRSLTVWLRYLFPRGYKVWMYEVWMLLFLLSSFKKKRFQNFLGDYTSLILPKDLPSPQIRTLGPQTSLHSQCYKSEESPLCKIFIFVFAFFISIAIFLLRYLLHFLHLFENFTSEGWHYFTSKIR